MGFRINAGVSVSGLLFFGTITSLFAKIVYELQGEGADGSVHHFHKPLFMCATMFLGMSLCLPIAYYEQYVDSKERDSSAEEPLLRGDGSQAQAKRSELHDVLLLLFPTVFDLIATVLMNIGLLWVTASVYQMMRGAEMIFAAILGIVFLKRHLNMWHFGGIMCCVAGISMVGSASLMSGEGSSSGAVDPMYILLGMGLIVASQCVQAAQLTFEDYFLAEMDMAPMKIVGYEGLLGFVIMVGVLMPIAQFMPGADGTGLHENSMDSIHMVLNNPHIATILLIDCFALLSYNFCGMSVTGNLGAVFRTVLETMRTLFVWMVDLFLFYCFSSLHLGESWNIYSYLQLAGFCVLVTGTLVFGKGNEQETKEIIAEIAEGGDEEGAAALAAGASSMAIPAMPASSEPIAMSASSRSSYKATMTITAGSLGTSYTGRISRH